MKRLLLATALLVGPVYGQEQDPPAPAPAPAPAPGPARDAHLAVLKKTVVHFDFKRATFQEILDALQRATKVPCAVGKKGEKALKRRKFKMKYIADRRGEQVLTDLAKAAALDVVVTADGVLFDTPKQIRKLRKKLGLKGKAVRATGADVTKMLQSKTLSLAARDQPLREVLDFLRKETGLRFVLAAEEQAAAKVTVIQDTTKLGVLLDKVTEQLGLDWIQQGSVILVDVAEEIAKQRKN